MIINTVKQLLKIGKISMYKLLFVDSSFSMAADNINERLNHKKEK